MAGRIMEADVFGTLVHATAYNGGPAHCPYCGIRLVHMPLIKGTMLRLALSTGVGREFRMAFANTMRASELTASFDFPLNSPTSNLSRWVMTERLNFFCR